VTVDPKVVPLPLIESLVTPNIIAQVQVKPDVKVTPNAAIKPAAVILAPSLRPKIKVNGNISEKDKKDLAEKEWNKAMKKNNNDVRLALKSFKLTDKAIENIFAQQAALDAKKK
jgi:hypothetical protein